MSRTSFHISYRNSRIGAALLAAALLLAPAPLPGAQAFSGRVVAAEDGRPLAAAMVTLAPAKAGSVPLAAAKTDVQGRFRLDLERHFRLPPATVSKVYGYFADFKSQAIRQVCHFNHEDITG